MWGAVAGGLGLASTVARPGIGLASLVLGALLVFNAIGLIAAQAALRDRPAAALSTE